MKGTLVGAVHKKGNFVNEESGQLIDYDNLVLTILVPVKFGGQFDPIEGCGMVVEKSPKCSFDSLTSVFGDDFKSIQDLSPLMGSEIEYFFDSSKKLARVLVI